MTYDQAIGSPSRTLYSRLSFTGLTITNAQVQKIVIDNNLLTGSDFEVGTAIADNATITLINKDAALTGYDFKNKEFNLELGIDVAGTPVYYSQGLFTVEDVQKNLGIITLIVIDRMYLFEKDYIQGLTYPTTLLQIAQDVCSQAGVTLDTTNFLNYGMVVATEPSLYGVTCRKMIAQIAELAGAYAKITTAGHLAIFRLSPVSAKTITTSNYITLTSDAAATVAIARVVVALGDEAVTQGEPAGDITTEYTVQNNIFVQVPADALAGVFSALNGLTYTPVDLKWQGDFSLRAGRYFTINTGTGTTATYLLNRQITYTGGMTEISSSPAQSAIRKDSAVNGPVRIALEKLTTEIAVVSGQIGLKVDQSAFDALGGIVNQAKTDIQINKDAIATKITKTDLDSKIANYYTKTETADGIATAVSSVQSQLTGTGGIVEQLNTVKSSITSTAIVQTVENNSLLLAKKTDLATTAEGVSLSVIATIKNDYGETISNIQHNFQFTDAVYISKQDSTMSIRIDEDSIEIRENAMPVMTITAQNIEIETATIKQALRIGVHQLEKYNSNVTLVKWVG